MDNIEQSEELQERIWRGFGSIPGETLDEFHERMYTLPPLEAMMYELDVELQRSG